MPPANYRLDTLLNRPGDSFDLFRLFVVVPGLLDYKLVHLDGLPVCQQSLGLAL